MVHDTSLGQGQSHFPSTVWEALEKSLRPEDHNALAERYWRPVYRFIRSVWKKPVEDAKDLTQEFFATVFDRDFLRAADRNRGNFRQFVLASLRNFLTDREREKTALKRGGGHAVISIDVGKEPESAIDPSLSAEAAFDQAWAAEILRRALERLEAEYARSGRQIQYEAFHRHSLSGQVSYRDIAKELKVGEFDVGNYLVAARKDLRRHCVELIRETVGDPSRVDEEVKALFGI